MSLGRGTSCQQTLFRVGLQQGGGLMSHLSNKGPFWKAAEHPSNQYLFKSIYPRVSMLHGISCTQHFIRFTWTSSPIHCRFIAFITGLTVLRLNLEAKIRLNFCLGYSTYLISRTILRKIVYRQAGRCQLRRLLSQQLFLGNQLTAVVLWCFGYGADTVSSKWTNRG